MSSEGFYSAFLTTEEVLGCLTVNPRTIYRLIKTGELPAVRIGRQWRFRRTDLDDWIARQRNGSIVSVRTATSVESPPTAESTPAGIWKRNRAHVRQGRTVFEWSGSVMKKAVWSGIAALFRAPVCP